MSLKNAIEKSLTELLASDLAPQAVIRFADRENSLGAITVIVEAEPEAVTLNRGNGQAMEWAVKCNVSVLGYVADIQADRTALEAAVNSAKAALFGYTQNDISALLPAGYAYAGHRQDDASWTTEENNEAYTFTLTIWLCDPRTDAEVASDEETADTTQET